MWLQDTIINGLSRLIVLRLQNCPPEDAVELTVKVWLEAITFKFPHLEEKLDRKRIEQAFLKLCCECERFPTPSMLIERMPPREIIALPEQEWTEQDRQKAIENIQKLQGILKKCTKATNVKR
ncbi:hypothetical protein EV694_1940 [Volucribacter psittacicida]|uniref:Uncharacterized protein n=1 Tax=Volucribacter psittacicida TaxID=203482 RepID=A0A4R1FM87_9PAST|nr:hypothetical protein [Volucribacter psittacicida]TCJ95937.1 hypothetical protein EV694_1940 [Volucribacter psittacicida]